MTYTTFELEADLFEASLSIAKATAELAKRPELRQDLMVVVNYREPSHRKRLYVVENGNIILTAHVAHGSGSSCSYNIDKACTFSNTPMSKRSSLGAMKTGAVYTGKYGKSLKLHGLDCTNSRVYARFIVLHPSQYVTESYIIQHGYAGHSWGCLAVNPIVAPHLIDLIKDGVFVFSCK
jgi:hypothetical protein